jgi:DnaJ-class molecular chaperone
MPECKKCEGTGNKDYRKHNPCKRGLFFIKLEFPMHHEGDLVKHRMCRDRRGGDTCTLHGCGNWIGFETCDRCKGTGQVEEVDLEALVVELVTEIKFIRKKFELNHYRYDGATAGNASVIARLDKLLKKSGG